MEKRYITIKELKENAFKKGFGFESYKPKRNKIKASFVLGFVVLCLITPCTNWLIVPLYKTLTKFPLWLYR